MSISVPLLVSGGPDPSGVTPIQAWVDGPDEYRRVELYRVNKRRLALVTLTEDGEPDDQGPIPVMLG